MMHLVPKALALIVIFSGSRRVNCEACTNGDDQCKLSAQLDEANDDASFLQMKKNASFPVMRKNASFLQTGRNCLDAADKSAASSDSQGPACKFDAPFGTQCPSYGRWADFMLTADPSPGKVVVDIGCKKGTGAIAWMERWDASAPRFWSSKQWVNHLKSHLGMRDRVFPNITTSSVATGHRPIGICVEAFGATIDLLRNASSALGYVAQNNNSGYIQLPHG
eukprot:gnl/TRDRNA2_/TRDRNA2_133526_c0_seq2.p1 gnl/TRDRNA2_/TRDRNA2_133526_c0~~gnl/TRDRNA2_/TRDRNA2_133526_c0_seq2.p1  ORF type:complete len:222 (-),score=20.44 gnl/TRDRNA2_/TRDRNA2_133526_c0_seq2:306-971(-)